MHLSKLRVVHFRALYDTGWVGFHDLTVLIGENDGGKTATLDALEILLGNKQPDMEDFSYAPGGVPDESGEVRHETELLTEAKFSLTDVERAEVGRHAPLQADGLHVRKRFTLEGRAEAFVAGVVPADERLRLDLEAANINDLRALARDKGIPVAGTAKPPIVEALRAFVATQPTVEGEVPLPGPVRAMLPEFTRFDSASDPESVVHGILRSVFRQEIEKPENAGHLGQVQENIAAKLRAEAAALNPFVHKYRPEVKSVTVDPQFNFESGFRATDLRLQDQNDRQILLEKRGTGVRKHITLAVYEWNSEILKRRQAEGARPLVLALDEPDTSLDYQSQRQLFDTIQGFVSPAVQVVICTHSMNLINRVPIEKLNHYSLNDDKTRSVVECFVPDPETPEEVDFFLHRLGDGLGLHNALMFYERCFLLIEGKTEEIAFPVIFKLCIGEHPYTKGVRIVNAFENHGAIVFARFLHKHDRKVVFAVDEDTTRNKGTRRLMTRDALERAGFDVRTQVHVIGPDHFEFSFEDAVWARVLRQVTGADTWTPETVRAFREPPQGFVDKLLGATGISDKPKLGLALAKSLSGPEDVPQCIKECIAKAVELAS